MKHEIVTPKGKHGGSRGNTEISSTAPNFKRLVWNDLLRDVYTARGAQRVNINRWARKPIMKDLFNNAWSTLSTLKNEKDAPRCVSIGREDVSPNPEPKPCKGCFFAEGTVCLLGINPSVRVTDESSEPTSSLIGRPSRQSWPRGSKVG